MSFSDWMLALHLLAAFAVAAALVMFSVLIFAGKRMTTVEQTRIIFRVSPIGTALVQFGMAVVFLVGVVLALDSDQFQLWDPWVLVAIVLVIALGGTGQRTGAYYNGVRDLADEGAPEAEVLARLKGHAGERLHLASIVLFVLVVLDMILKPGA